MKTWLRVSGKMNMKRLIQATTVLLCLTLVFAAASGRKARAERTAGDKESRIVRVGWYDSSFNMIDSHNRRSGYAYEYQMKIAAYTGWEYEYISGSWPDLLQMLKDGKIDLMSDVSYRPERAEEMLFPSLSLPMGSENYYLFTDPTNKEIISSDYSSLNGKTIGVNQDSVQAGYFREWAEQHGVDCKLRELTSTEEESLLMLKQGEIDGYVTVDSFAAEIIEEAGRPIPVWKIGSSDFYFAVSKQRPELLPELEKALIRIQEEDRHYDQKLAEKSLNTTGANAFLTTEEEKWLEQHGLIRIGYQDNYLAFCTTDEDTGELTGALKDYLENAENCMINASIRFETMAFPTVAAAIKALQKGEIDCVFPANFSTGDGDELGIFMSPELMRTDLFAVVQKEDRQRFAGRDHVVVAVNEGNLNYDSTLRDLFPTWRPVVYPTTADCLEAVSRGVADCVLISSYRYNNIARQCEKLDLVTIATGEELSYSFAMASGNPELYSIMARVTNLIPRSTVSSALNHYITEDAKTTLGDFVEKYKWIVIGVAGGVLLVILGLLLRSMAAQRKATRLIAATETDSLTGLYNRDYFLQYAGRMRR